MTENKEYSALEKAIEYARKLEGITYLEWQILQSGMNAGFRIKQSKLNKNVKLALDELIVGDRFID